MKFSLFYEMQISDPTPEKERRVFLDAVEQVVLADQLGYHSVWEVEHHGLREYSHSSAPEVFLAFVAAKTKRIRIGHGVTLLPYRYNHPIRIAERIATLDILSGGRVNWGTGKSASRTEMHAFQCDIPQLHDQWLEAIQIIPRMWREEVFQHKGRFFDIPPTQIIPKPVQDPHPPIYAACSRPESTVFVGKLGLGALNFAIGNDEYLTKKVAEYRRAAALAKPENYKKTVHFACTPVGLCLKDDKKACEYGMRGAAFFAEALAAYYFSENRPLGRLDIPREFLDPEALESAMAFRSATDAPAMNVIGDPVHCREIVSRFAAAGVDEIILAMQAGTVPHELVMESIELFAKEVMPHFPDRPLH
jgi:alkanesulfonate monooxygenase SsuD/methylene tetrahydromethanopterin reductase-like flavin-dependent oxidoreductase (luciferase family)